MTLDRVAGSFRDPSGFLCWHDGQLLRQIGNSYSADFDLLTESGLYDELTAADLLIRHQIVTDAAAPVPETKCVIQPDFVPQISYPYETQLA